MTPYFPDARGGGGVAHELELLRVAAERHDITVLSAYHPSGKVTLKAGDRELPLETVYWDGNKRRFPTGRLDLTSQFIRGWPTHDQWVVAEGTRVLRRAVAGFLQREPVDLVHLTHANVAPVVAASRAPTALLLFDLLSRQLAREGEVAESPQRRLRFALERRRTAAWEARWYARATGVASVSPTEADVLGRVLGREVPVIPNPVADMFFDPPGTERTKREATFVAHLGWRPNVDAVDWFVDEIWPRVIARVPDAELVVVGAQPGPRMLETVERVGGRVPPTSPTSVPTTGAPPSRSHRSVWARASATRCFTPWRAARRWLPRRRRSTGSPRGLASTCSRPTTWRPSRTRSSPASRTRPPPATAPRALARSSTPTASSTSASCSSSGGRRRPAGSRRARRGVRGRPCHRPRPIPRR